MFSGLLELISLKTLIVIKIKNKILEKRVHTINSTIAKCLVYTPTFSTFCLNNQTVLNTLFKSKKN